MGSIRPLVTITILAVVGAYLYVKINEGPVPTRVGTNGLSQSPEGVPPLTGTAGASLAAEGGAPAWPTTTAAPPSTSAAPISASAIPPNAAAANSKDSYPATPAIPELPPLPSISEPANSAAQAAAKPTNDSPANVPAARSPDQAAQGSNAAASSDTLGQLSPLTSTDPGMAVPPTAQSAAPSVTPQPAPMGVGAAPTTPAAQSSAQNPLRTTTPDTTPAADPSDRYATASAAAEIPVPVTAPTTSVGTSDATSFTASWPAIQSALDRRDLKQAHQLLSKWHGSESLSPTDTEKVETLLSQLAGTVIYSTEHQLEPARVVKPGDTLETISKEYNIPSQLLAKINGIQTPDQIQPGQQLKVVRGPFAAVVDLRRNEMTLMVDDRYAGKFRVTVSPGIALTDGQWLVDQKLAGPTSTASPSAYATTPILADYKIVLRNAAGTATEAPTLVIGSGPTPAGSAESPPSLRVSPQDAEELSDILSIGSRVVVRK